MRHHILSIFLLIPALSFAQERKDTLYLLDGSKEAVTLKANYEDRVEYVHEGESMVNILSKDRIHRISLGSGRVIEISSGYGNPDVLRMLRLREAGVTGSADLVKSDKIALGLKLSDSVRSRVLSPLNGFQQYYLETFIGTHGVGNIYFIGEKDSAPVYAEMTVVAADDDGESYGILDYYRHGEDTPSYSVTFRGEAARRGSTFDERLIGSAKKIFVLHPGILIGIPAQYAAGSGSSRKPAEVVTDPSRQTCEPGVRVPGRDVLGQLPSPNTAVKYEGVVVVDIWVDQYGNVTKAVAGGQGTTLTAAKIWTAARNAALKVRFSTSAEAPSLQKGTISYAFKVK